MTQEIQHPIFSFDTQHPDIVTISFTDTGKHTSMDHGSVLQDLRDHVDENLRSAGYIYNIECPSETQTINISPFEDTDPFNQEVFDIIAEELQFMDTFIRGESEDGFNTEQED